MGCKGCGKDDVAAIARASAVAAMAPVRDARVAAFIEESRAMPKTSRRPEMWQRPCRLCGITIEQPYATLQRDGVMPFCETCLPIAKADGWRGHPGNGEGSI